VPPKKEKEKKIYGEDICQWPLLEKIQTAKPFMCM
jgi:hypothetical protein